MTAPLVDVLWLNGTVGVGKTTVAEEISIQESRLGVAHALIDADAVRGLRPAPPSDPFQLALLLENLRDLARNYRRAGAARLVLAGVIESARDADVIAGALGATRMLVVRLTAEPDVLTRRLTGRHRDDPDGLAWHLRRAPELEAVLARAHGDQVVLEASADPPPQLARRARGLAGWERPWRGRVEA